MSFSDFCGRTMTETGLLILKEEKLKALCGADLQPIWFWRRFSLRVAT